MHRLNGDAAAMRGFAARGARAEPLEVPSRESAAQIQREIRQLVRQLEELGVGRAPGLSHIENTLAVVLRDWYVPPEAEQGEEGDGDGDGGVSLLEDGQK